jgi:hypothetical protein
MKKQKNLSKPVFWVALVTALILSVPLVAMQFNSGVNWSITDFVIMGVLIFTTGLSYVLLTRSSPNIIHRAAVALAIGSTLFLIWVNLAVGIIGSGPNAGNLMYIGILAIVITGTFLSRFTTKGMERVMFTAALTLVSFAGIQLFAGMQYYPGSSVKEIIGVNAFFAILFAVAGLLFRYISLKNLPAHSNQVA